MTVRVRCVPLLVKFFKYQDQDVMAKVKLKVTVIVKDMVNVMVKIKVKAEVSWLCEGLLSERFDRHNKHQLVFYCFC